MDMDRCEHEVAPWVVQSKSYNDMVTRVSTTAQPNVLSVCEHCQPAAASNILHKVGRVSTLILMNVKFQRRVNTFTLAYVMWLDGNKSSWFGDWHRHHPSAFFLDITYFPPIVISH